MRFNPSFLLDEDDIFVDEFTGVLPNDEFLVKIYCKKMRKGTEIKQQIISALKLQRLVEKEIKELEQEGGTNTSSDSWVIACYQTLERLLEESKK